MEDSIEIKKEILVDMLQEIEDTKDDINNDHLRLLVNNIEQLEKEIQELENAG